MFASSSGLSRLKAISVAACALTLAVSPLRADTLLDDDFAGFDSAAWTYAAHAGAAPVVPDTTGGVITLDNGVPNSSNRAAIVSTVSRANPFVSPVTITLAQPVLATSSTLATSVGYVLIGREETDTGAALTVAQVKNYGSTANVTYDAGGGALALNFFRNNATGVLTLVVYDLGASATSATWTLDGMPSAITWILDGTGATNTHTFTLDGAAITARPTTDTGTSPSVGGGTWAKDARFGAASLAVGDITVARIAVGAINAGNLSAGATTRFSLAGITVTDTTPDPEPPDPVEPPSHADSTQIVFGLHVGGSTPLSFFPGAGMGVEWATGRYSTQPSGALSGDTEDFNAGTPGRLTLPAIGAFASGLTVNVRGYNGATQTTPSPFLGAGFSLIRPDSSAFHTGDSLVLTFDQDVEVKNIAFYGAAPTESVEISVAGNVIHSGGGYHLATNPLDLGRAPLAAGQELRIRALASSDGFHLSTLTIAAPDTPDAIELPKILAPGSVLQRDVAVPVWGRGWPGETVTATVNAQSKSAVADANGDFEILLDPEPAGGPHTLVVAGTVSTAVSLDNIYFGDVWLCSGQSNMWYRLADHLAQYPAAYGPVPAPDDNRDDLRFIMLATENASAPRAKPTPYIPWSPWKNIPLQAGAQFNWMSATPYFFGKTLRAALDANGQAHVPLGLVIAAYGGTSIEQWIPAGPLAAAGPWASGAISPAISSDCYNAMIAPIERFPIKGAIWYQGENNSGNLVRTAAYARLQETLAASWRAARGHDFPFYFVQLAGYMRHRPFPTENDASVSGYNINWAWLREAQTASRDTIPNSGMAVAIDTGDQSNIHPSGKDVVARRLALLAQANDYGIPVVARGPVLVDQHIDGAEILLTFDHVGGGLQTLAVDAQPDAAELSKNTPAVRAAADTLRGFAIAGADQVFYHATRAEIVGENQIRVANPADVPAPVAVRYAWQSFPNANLHGGTGLPAEPFRTDTFAPGSSGGADSSPVADPIADLRAFESASLVIDLDAHFRDIEDADAGLALAYAVTGNTAPAIVTSATIADGRLTLVVADTDGTAGLTVTATDSAGRTAAATFAVSRESATFAAWQHHHFTPETLADPELEAALWGPAADPDADGRANLLEYAAATDPLTADPATAPLSILAENDHIVVRYRRAKALAADPAVSLQLETGTTLAPDDWLPLDAPDTLHADLGDAELRQVLLPADGSPRRFIRLTVTREP